MFVAVTAAIVLMVAVVVAALVLGALRTLFRSNRAIATSVSVIGAGLGVAVVGVQARWLVIESQPVSSWSGVTGLPTAYFLAMAHFLINSPYPGTWTAAGTYPLGLLTMLMPAAALVAVTAGLLGRQAAPRICVLAMACGVAVLVLYVAGAVHASLAARYGVPL